MNKHLKITKACLGFFIIVLALSGLTAVPIDQELTFLLHFVSPGSATGHWLTKVLSAYRQVSAEHPFLIYGYDWLAFAHLVLAILFIGPFKDPVKNIWVIEFGLIACLLVIPLALVAGSFRQIPLGWRLLDCSFGLFGAIPLLLCYKHAKDLQHQLHTSI